MQDPPSPPVQGPVERGGGRVELSSRLPSAVATYAHTHPCGEKESLRLRFTTSSPGKLVNHYHTCACIFEVIESIRNFAPMLISPPCSRPYGEFFFALETSQVNKVWRRKGSFILLVCAERVWGSLPKTIVVYV